MCCKADPQQENYVPCCRQVKAVEFGRGDVRAVEGCQAIDAAKVDDYLARAFEGRLRDAEAALAVRRPPVGPARFLAALLMLPEPAFHG